MTCMNGYVGLFERIELVQIHILGGFVVHAEHLF